MKSLLLMQRSRSQWMIYLFVGIAARLCLLAELTGCAVVVGYRASVVGSGTALSQAGPGGWGEHLKFSVSTGVLPSGETTVSCLVVHYGDRDWEKSPNTFLWPASKSFFPQ